MSSAYRFPTLEIMQPSSSQGHIVSDEPQEVYAAAMLILHRPELTRLSLMDLPVSMHDAAPSCGGPNDMAIFLGQRRIYMMQSPLPRLIGLAAIASFKADRFKLIDALVVQLQHKSPSKA